MSIAKVIIEHILWLIQKQILGKKNYVFVFIIYLVGCFMRVEFYVDCYLQPFT